MDPWLNHSWMVTLHLVTCRPLWLYEAHLCACPLKAKPLNTKLSLPKVGLGKPQGLRRSILYYSHRHCAWTSSTRTIFATMGRTGSACPGTCDSQFQECQGSCTPSATSTFTIHLRSPCQTCRFKDIHDSHLLSLSMAQVILSYRWLDISCLYNRCFRAENICQLIFWVEMRLWHESNEHVYREPLGLNSWQAHRSPCCCHPHQCDCMMEGWAWPTLHTIFSVAIHSVHTLAK